MIRKATWQDIAGIAAGYAALLAHEKAHGAYTAWKSGVYPTRETAAKGVTDGAIYVTEEAGGICASILINQTQPPEYAAVDWQFPAQPKHVLVIHLLCVRPSKARRGIGQAMVRFAIDEGKRRQCVTVRLDTGAQNTPAIALYQKLGFSLAGTATMAIGGLIAHDHHLFFEKAI